MRERAVALSRAILPWIITAILLAIVFAKVDFAQAVDKFRGANLHLFLPVAIFFNIYVLFINAYVYTFIVNRYAGPIDYKTVLSIRGASYLLTSVNTGAGQGGLMYLLSRRSGIDIKKIISAALIMPVVDLMFVASALLLPLAAHLIFGGVIPEAQSGILFAVLGVMWALVLLHLWFWRLSPDSFMRRLKDWEFTSAYRKAGVKDYLTLLGIRCFQHIPGIVAFWLALQAFHGVVPFPTFVARFFPALIIQSLPITVAQLGTSQGGWILMFGDIVDHNVLIAYTFSWNFLYFLSRVGIGAFFFRGEVRKFFHDAGAKAAQEKAAS